MHKQDKIMKDRNRLSIKLVQVFSGVALVLAVAEARGAEQVSASAVQSMVVEANTNAARFKASQNYNDIVSAATSQASAVKADQSFASITPAVSAQSVMTTLGINTTTPDTPSGQDNIGAPNPKVAQGAIEFVSLDMPVASLRQILSDASAYNIPVVIRGLLQNNWKYTTAAITNILQPPGGTSIPGSFEIDPLWFRTFGITQVPALVVVAPGSTCAPQDKACVPAFDVVYGNVPVSRALSLIAQNGSVGQATASQYLKMGGGNDN
jgi:conjugal transfer pilus assembly protein TrbC